MFAPAILWASKRNRTLRHRRKMGYSTNIFIVPVDRNLLCGICKEVLKNPRTLHCGHTYCEDCLDGWFKSAKDVKLTCPMCRRYVILSITAPVLALREFIEGLSVECKNAVNGCKMVLKLRDLEKHLENCDFTLVECSGCDEMFSQNDFHVHRNKCPKLNETICFDARVHAEIAAIQNELFKTKKSLRTSEETVQRLESILCELRAQRRIRAESTRAEDFRDSKWDPDYSYGYSPQSISNLSTFISRFLTKMPPYVDQDRIFICLKRCFDFYHNCAAFWQDVHMLLATALASGWIRDEQCKKLDDWLTILARERLLK
ncbi:RING finger protein 151-like [Stylophora pistillata]|uniref:RING finger protein 151-like n=1 Tax=Stylophora pistillata TaxID=50429 RepID=UPI000C056449|nr:RING finger protein 151-like [Stylophora pistillata]